MSLIQASDRECDNQSVIIPEVSNTFKTFVCQFRGSGNSTNMDL